MSTKTTPTTRQRFFDMTINLTWSDGKSIECKTVVSIDDFSRLVETCIANDIKLEVTSAAISKSVS